MPLSLVVELAELSLDYLEAKLLNAIFQRYGKTIISVCGTIAAVGSSGVWEDGISQREFWALILLAGANAGVWAAPAITRANVNALAEAKKVNP